LSTSTTLSESKMTPSSERSAGVVLVELLIAVSGCCAAKSHLGLDLWKERVLPPPDERVSEDEDEALGEAGAG
jgi:hypothetical protein